MKRRLGGVSALAVAAVVAAQELPPGSAALRQRAQELLRAERWTEAAEQFRLYLQTGADDPATALDYAALLAQLNRREEAARALEAVRARHPRHEPVLFRLAAEYAALERWAEARSLFTELQGSANPEMAAAAGAALQRLEADAARRTRMGAEQRVFDLAAASRHAEVVAAVNELERQGALSFLIEMQRLYAWSALGDFAPATRRAEELARQRPDSPDLALVRADLLARQGRLESAATMWREIIARFPGTAAAREADRRLKGEVMIPMAATPHHSPGPEAAVYELARQQKHREVIAAIGVLERAGPLSWPMELQRLYAWQALGEHATALERAGQLAATHPDSPELALIRSDLLIAAGQVVEAGQLLQTVTARHGGADAAEKARSRLESLPPIANPDRRWWGEAYASGDWHDRWGTLIGSGFVRHGAFLPGARWAQPYAEFRFGVDTDSEAGPDRTIIQDNFIGAFAGARVQPIASEYFFLYAQAGTSTDLLDRRAGGAWAFDYQVGLYGYKAWGPGMNLLAAGGTSGTNTSAWWRAGLGDWWADAGADFSWYGRYDSWIGYGQARQGLRLAQVGPRVAFDAYVLEGLSWDVKGNYFDNLIEAGPGLRLVWRPHARWQVVARTEFVGGWYLGRDRPGDRAGTGRTYDDLRLGVAVGTRW